MSRPRKPKLSRAQRQKIERERRSRERTKAGFEARIQGIRQETRSLLRKIQAGEPLD